MTLILGMANGRHAVLLSDRRIVALHPSQGLVSPKGQPITEQSNKATSVTCANARVAMGFSGIAEAGSFRTDPWIIDTLSSYRGPPYDVRSVFEWFNGRLSAEFASNPELRRLPPADRRLSLMGIGYVGPCDDARYVNVLVTNFQDADELRDAREPWSAFRTWWWLQKRGAPNATHVQRIGAWRATTLEDLDVLRAALERDAPVEELVGTGVRYMRSVADRPAAGGTVGKSISSIVVPRDGSVTVAGFHPHEALDFIPGVNTVVLRPEGGAAFKNVKIRRVAATGDTRIVPRVGRNKPCPCGSGKKYKTCHGNRVGQ